MLMIPGEWATDENGRRYRMVGNTKEYEPDFITTGGKMNAEQLKAWNETRPEREAAARKAEKDRDRKLKDSHRICPFKKGFNTFCKVDQCAFYSDSDGCIFSRSEPIKDTKGLPCPFTNISCSEKCALYHTVYPGGCHLTGITRSEEVAE